MKALAAVAEFVVGSFAGLQGAAHRQIQAAIELQAENRESPRPSCAASEVRQQTVLRILFIFSSA